MKQIGKIGSYTIFWDAQGGQVRVGAEVATDASGQTAYAYSEDRAMEVARDYIRKALGG